MSDKPKLAMYWAASCGGCEIALVNINEALLDLAAAFDFMFCPCLLDTKKADIEALPDKSIAITLFNGAIRTTENGEMALLLRRKSQLLIAFGSCACEGCIPALANLSSKQELLRTVYLDNPSIDNPDRIIPSACTDVPEGALSLPPLHERVRTLAQVTGVDYSIPGCPPESHQIRAVIEAVASGAPLPPAGSVLGAGRLSVCDECPRVKEDKRIDRLYRAWEITPEPERCLLEQGLLCMGIATRDGCGAPCPRANMPCTGCYGPPEGTSDQGARMVAALGSILDIGDCKGQSEEEIAARVETLLDAVPDYAGSFYKYGLAGSIIGGRVDT